MLEVLSQEAKGGFPQLFQNSQFRYRLGDCHSHFLLSPLAYTKEELTIKTNGKNSRSFDRSSVIIKRNVENMNLHRYIN